MITKLRMTEEQHSALRSHLLPADGGEAAAVMLCGRASSPDVHTLVGKEVVLIPLSDCIVRGPDRLEWRTDMMVPLIERARREHLAVVKLHSHPGGFAEFSEADDRADTALFDSIHGWVEDGLPHASVVMLPDGACFGRRTFGSGLFEPLASIAVAGRRIENWPARVRGPSGFTLRHAQAFGSTTAARLQQMSVAVVGCSGTGSIVTELLTRLGVGRLVLVDPDVVEEKNLNRILHASVDDATGARPKVEVAARAIAASGLPTQVVPLYGDLLAESVIRQVASCDVVFGCVDAYLPRPRARPNRHLLQPAVHRREGSPRRRRPWGDQPDLRRGSLRTTGRRHPRSTRGDRSRGRSRRERASGIGRGLRAASPLQVHPGRSREQSRGDLSEHDLRGARRHGAHGPSAPPSPGRSG